MEGIALPVFKMDRKMMAGRCPSCDWSQGVYTYDRSETT